MSAAEVVVGAELHEWFGDDVTLDGCEKIALTLLDALKAAGHAVVELPTAEEVEDYGLYVSRAPHFGLPVGEEHDQGSRFRSIDETRRYAAALLAVAEAADAAEDTP